jgi:hypothetical protein
MNDAAVAKKKFRESLFRKQADESHIVAISLPV